MCIRVTRACNGLSAPQCDIAPDSHNSRSAASLRLAYFARMFRLLLVATGDGSLPLDIG